MEKLDENEDEKLKDNQDEKQDEKQEKKQDKKQDKKVKVMFQMNVKYGDNVLKNGDVFDINKDEVDDFERLGIAKVVE